MSLEQQVLYGMFGTAPPAEINDQMVAALRELCFASVHATVGPQLAHAASTAAKVEELTHTVRTLQRQLADKHGTVREFEVTEGPAITMRQALKKAYETTTKQAKKIEALEKEVQDLQIQVRVAFDVATSAEDDLRVMDTKWKAVYAHLKHCP